MPLYNAKFDGSSLATRSLSYSVLAKGILPSVTISPKGLSSGASIPNDGADYGPDTVGTTTCGIQEAMNALDTNTDLHTPPAGGGTLKFGMGVYQCTGQIVIPNRLANMYSWEGVVGTGTIINYNGPLNQAFITTGARTGGGGGISYTWMVEDIFFTWQPYGKGHLFQLFDIGNIYFTRCTFTTWSQVAVKDGLNQSVFTQYQDTIAEGVVGHMLGKVDRSDSPFGLVVFTDCRWQNLAAGVLVNLDHVYFDQCSFTLIGGGNKLSPSNNLWTANGGVLPDAAYAFHPSVIHNSTNGDVRFTNCAWYQAYCALLNWNVNHYGQPVFQNVESAQLEGAAWLVLQLDDTSNGLNVPAGPVKVECRPDRLISNTSLVTKTGTILNKVPPNLSFIGGNAWTRGDKNYFMFGGTASDAAPYAAVIGNIVTATMPSGLGLEVASEICVPNGRTLFRGSTVIDNLFAGVSYDDTTLTVSGGSRAGINGSYTYEGLKDASVAGGGIGKSWTNSNYRIILSGVGGEGGEIYLKTDTAYTNLLYDNSSAPDTWGNNVYVSVAGVYHNINGGGTPPTVAPLTKTINTSTFAGPVMAPNVTFQKRFSEDLSDIVGATPSVLFSTNDPPISADPGVGISPIGGSIALVNLDGFGDGKVMIYNNQWRNVYTEGSPARTAFPGNPKSASDVILGQDSGAMYDNRSSVGLVTLTLPAAQDGRTFGFFVAVAQAFKIKAVGSDVIRNGNAVSAAAGFLQSSTVGNFVWITSPYVGIWFVMSITGTWTLT